MISRPANVLFAAGLAASVLCALTDHSSAQGNAAAPSAGTGGDSKTDFNAATPGNATVNANGQPLEKDSNKIVPRDSDPANVPNLNGGTSVNPYTGVPVGQPLHPNDLGSKR